ncbi:hypothetical protein [Hymenobacter sp. B1770]|uniref:hypothetical protein n=1 Tax=Hymenobacter sp. B1770 TaxID=1718788 RepID=UPI003CEF6AB4
MKKVILAMSLLLCTSYAKAQIVTLNKDRVEVRNEQGSYVTSRSVSGLKDAIGGNGFVVFWYENGRVESRDMEQLNLISSRSFSDVKTVRASGKNIVVQYTNGRTEILDPKLNRISSRI